MTIPQAFELALQHHRDGRLPEAEAIYRQILDAQPDHADALHMMGVIANHVGRGDLGADFIGKALRSMPDNADAHNNLGNAFFIQGEVDSAVASYSRAVQIQPGDAVAHNNLGAALRKRGSLDASVTACRRAIQIRADYADAHNNLGVALMENGRADESAAACREAIRLKPDFPEACYNLGNALKALEQWDGALAAYRDAIRVRPDFELAHMNLGETLKLTGQWDGAMECLQRAIQLKPDFSEAHNNLGNVLLNRGCPDDAIASYRQAANLAPASPAIHSSFLASLHYSLRTTPADLLAEHAEYERRHCAPFRSAWRDHGNAPDPARHLKVGYVSPDFRHNVVAHFLMSLLEAHDHEQCEVHCYSSVVRADAITERFKKTADVWRDVTALSDEALAERIREDRIDILVDLSQHMPGNRLLVFARKPAPVQVAWLGHPWSTGLRAIDFRLTDSWMEPERSAWSESVEVPVRLPDSWFCFDPIDESPEPGELPALRAGHVTFGCLNNFARVNEAVMERWAKILCGVENSRLLLRCPSGATQARVLRFFEAHGIDAARVEFAGWTATRIEFQRLFDRMDIALDPFPYNGGTTTCDTLWMGVPVLTLPGEMVVSRIGLSILAACGLTECVAHSESEYLRLAVSLATDLPRLAALRSTLRQRMKASAFMDAPRFARDVEQAYRGMWRKWCAR